MVERGMHKLTTCAMDIYVQKVEWCMGYSHVLEIQCEYLRKRDKTSVISRSEEDTWCSIYRVYKNEMFGFMHCVNVWFGYIIRSEI